MSESVVVGDKEKDGETFLKEVDKEKDEGREGGREEKRVMGEESSLEPISWQMKSTNILRSLSMLESQTSDISDQILLKNLLYLSEICQTKREDTIKLQKEVEQIETLVDAHSSPAVDIFSLLNPPEEEERPEEEEQKENQEEGKEEQEEQKEGQEQKEMEEKEEGNEEEQEEAIVDYQDKTKIFVPPNLNGCTRQNLDIAQTPVSYPNPFRALNRLGGVSVQEEEEKSEEEEEAEEEEERKREEEKEEEEEAEAEGEGEEGEEGEEKEEKEEKKEEEEEKEEKKEEEKEDEMEESACVIINLKKHKIFEQFGISFPLPIVIPISLNEDNNAQAVQEKYIKQMLNLPTIETKQERKILLGHLKKCAFFLPQNGPTPLKILNDNYNLTPLYLTETGEEIPDAPELIFTFRPSLHLNFQTAYSAKQIAVNGSLGVTITVTEPTHKGPRHVSVKQGDLVIEVHKTEDDNDNNDNNNDNNDNNESTDMVIEVEPSTTLGVHHATIQFPSPGTYQAVAKNHGFTVQSFPAVIKVSPPSKWGLFGY